METVCAIVFFCKEDDRDLCELTISSEAVDYFVLINVAKSNIKDHKIGMYLQRRANAVFPN